MTGPGANLFAEFVRFNWERVERSLDEMLPRAQGAGTKRFNEALNYAIFPGGKRLRAHITFIAARLVGSSDAQALALACAIEFIHTSSLVLDDLPSMDDADLRRQRSALHLVFGEATAVLVAVALLNQAYALLPNAVADDAPAKRLRRFLSEACGCVGSSGMVGGQAAELALSGIQPTAEALASRELKTTALTRFMLAAGAIACGRPEADIAALAEFGEHLGHVYQMYDDLADSLGDQSSTGKSIRQDARHERPTLESAMRLRDGGMYEFTARAAATISSANAILNRFQGQADADRLRSAATFILSRFDKVTSSPHLAT
jgi:geranylgeranyl diphosphate synthase type II